MNVFPRDSCSTWYNLENCDTFTLHLFTPTLIEYINGGGTSSVDCRTWVSVLLSWLKADCLLATPLSYGTPFLLSLGLSEQLTSLVWLAGPISGLIAQPLIGT